MRRGFALCSTLLLAAGCTLLGGPEYYLEPNYYAVTAVGSGGAGATGTASAATSGNASGSGGVTEVECDKSLCQPAKHPACGSIVCLAEDECGLVLEAPGALCAGYLGEKVCADDGRCVECLEKSETEHCTDPTRPYCIDAACVECRADDDCTTPGEIVCDQASHRCVQCVEGDDAPCKAIDPQFVCAGTSCKLPTCKNGALDAELETDVDCGGTCSPCGDKKLCQANSDCVTSLCLAEGAAMVCSCSDASQCSATEYCSGNHCVPRKDKGSGCSAASECLSNNCSTGVTCWFSACCQ